METKNSNVRRIKEQLESQAAFAALYGLSQGVSKHETFNAKLDRIGKLQEEFTTLIGSEQADQYIVEVFS